MPRCQRAARDRADRDCENGACPPDGSVLERDPTVGIEQRQYFSSPQPGLAAGFPKYLDADGGGSPVFAPLEPSGRNALILSDGNGYVHAYLPNGKEAPGFPVHTDPIALPTTGTNCPFVSSQRGILRPAPMPSTSVCSGSGMGVAQIKPNVP